MTTAVVDVESVRTAIAAVDDPEFPGVSIAELGLLESVSIDGDSVTIDLVPTFLGCPALNTIRADVAQAALAVPGVSDVDVRFVDSPVWTPDRVSQSGRMKLAAEFTVAVRTETTVVCPVCGATRVEEKSPFGPTACRAIAYCDSCRNPVEVMRQ